MRFVAPDHKGTTGYVRTPRENCLAISAHLSVKKRVLYCPTTLRRREVGAEPSLSGAPSLALLPFLISGPDLGRGPTVGPPEFLRAPIP